MHKKESVFKRVISRTLGNKKTQSVTIPLLCVLIGLIVDVYKRQSEDGVSFVVEGQEDAQLTIGLQDDTEYDVRLSLIHI